MILEGSIKSLLSVLYGLAKSERTLNRAVESYKTINSNKANKDNEDDEKWSDEEVIRLLVSNPYTVPFIKSTILCTLYNISTRMFRTFEIMKLKSEPLKYQPHYEPEEDERKLMALLKKFIKMGSFLVSSALKLRSHIFT